MHVRIACLQHADVRSRLLAVTLATACTQHVLVRVNGTPAWQPRTQLLQMRELDAPDRTALQQVNEACKCRVVLTMASVGLVILTCMTDPGMLPRLEPTEAYVRGTQARWAACLCDSLL